VLAVQQLAVFRMATMAQPHRLSVQPMVAAVEVIVVAVLAVLVVVLAQTAAMVVVLRFRVKEMLVVRAMGHTRAAAVVLVLLVAMPLLTAVTAVTVPQTTMTV
jgi:hypothetical protein